MTKNNDKLEQALKYAMVTNQIEGKEVSNEVVELVRDLHTKKITRKEFDEEVRRRLNAKYGED